MDRPTSRVASPSRAAGRLKAPAASVAAENSGAAVDCTMAVDTGAPEDVT